MVAEVGIWMPAASYGGAIGRVVGVTVHSLECPLQEGYAPSLAGPNWFGSSKAGTSPHGTVGPEVIIRQVQRSRVAYHCGRKGNGVLIGREQCGYARFDRATWLSDKGMRQMRNLAMALAVDCIAHGIPVRKASAAELAQAVRTGKPCGIVAHDDVRAGLGGTTHTDPGASYPWDVLIPLVQQAADLLLGKTPTTPIQEDDMDAIQDQYLAEVRYATLAEIAPNVVSTNGAVADIHVRTDALQKQLTAQGDLLAKIAAKIGA